MKKFTTELRETIIDRLNDYWDNKFKLIDEVIKEITDQLRELNINDEDLF